MKRIRGLQQPEGQGPLAAARYILQKYGDSLVRACLKHVRLGLVEFTPEEAYEHLFEHGGCSRCQEMLDEIEPNWRIVKREVEAKANQEAPVPAPLGSRSLKKPPTRRYGRKRFEPDFFDSST